MSDAIAPRPLREAQTTRPRRQQSPGNPAGPQPAPGARRLGVNNVATNKQGAVI